MLVLEFEVSVSVGDLTDPITVDEPNTMSIITFLRHSVFLR